MIDVHKACNLLVDFGLLSIETKMLANKKIYFESYLKQIPQDKSVLVDFTIRLSKFGILDVNDYFDTLKISKLIFSTDASLAR